jgi:hypothetical protein
MVKDEALFLADELEAPLGTVISSEVDRRAAAELRRLHAEVEDLKRTLAASCDEERSQLWEAGPGGGCARALSAEFRCAELLEALRLVVHLNERDVPMTDEELRVCRAAITKAAGEQT